MNDARNRQVSRMVLAGLVLTAMSAFARAADRPPAEPVHRYYFADLSVFSIRPEAGVSTYRGSAGTVGAGATGTASTHLIQGDRRFEVEIAGRMNRGRFLVDLAVKPHPRDTKTVSLEKELDLTDLTPVSIELAKDEDGRIYRVTIVPTVREVFAPQPLEVQNLRLESFSFNQSDVILNDEDYLGQISMSHGSLATLEIPGLAEIEYSLLHLKDAKPTGSLSGGVVTIANEDGTSIRITNVTNGRLQQVLEGGPYLVWVRWKPPTTTLEQAREARRKLYDELMERRKAGDESLPEEILERLRQQTLTDRPQLSSSSVGPVPAGDIVTDQ